jgi:hypothetical protein
MDMDDMFGEEDDDIDDDTDSHMHNDDTEKMRSQSQSKEKRPWSKRLTPRQYSSDGYNAAAAIDDGAADGLDIQSLSVVQAEFLYDRREEEKKAANPSALENKEETVAKRIINLDSFHIIKCIGRGIKIHILLYI